MDIHMISGLVGVFCLGLASLAMFLMIPERELTARERIGIHTIFWTFAVYAMWTIYTTSTASGAEKAFYVFIPFLLGLILSLMSELRVRQPSLEIDNARLRIIVEKTWSKLPINIKKGLQSTIMLIKEIPEWTDLDEQYFHEPKTNSVKWFPILPLPARGIIYISKAESNKHPDSAVMFSIAREFALAYQSTLTPFDSERIKRGASELPPKWGFKQDN